MPQLLFRLRKFYLLGFPGAIFTPSLYEAPSDTMNQGEARMAQFITLKVDSNLTFANLVNRLREIFIIVCCDATLTQYHVRPKAL